MVTVDGVVQAPTTNYTLSSTLPRTLTTTSVVPNGKVLQVLTVQGIVSSVFADGTVGTDAIVDDAVTLDKINIGVGAADRFLVFDINGDGTARVLVHTDISDFDAGVQANRLDQMATPTADVALGSQKITGLGAGANAADAVNKGQMEAAITSAIPSAVNKSVGGSITLNSSNTSDFISLPGTPYVIIFKHDGGGLGGDTIETIFASDLPYLIIPSFNSTFSTVLTYTGSGISVTLSNTPSPALGDCIFQYAIITD